METFGLLYPGDTTLEGRYANRPALGVSPEGGNYGWTTSFWPGVLWLAYELTGEDRYRELASAHVASFAARIEDEVDLNTHDLGFLYTLACVPAWRHDGDERARTTALAAAEHLAGRFLEPAGIVQAWGDLVNDPEQRGRTIIDSLMNMPLLHWAGDQTGQARFGAMARRHVTQLARHIVRPDDTTFHTFYWDVETGEPSHGRTQQGLRRRLVLGARAGLGRVRFRDQPPLHGRSRAPRGGPALRAVLRVPPARRRRGVLGPRVRRRRRQRPAA